MVRDWVLDDFEKLFLGSRRPNAEFVEQLNHEAGEALECARDANSRRDFDEHAFGGVDIDLELASLVDGRVKEREKTLRTLTN